MSAEHKRPLYAFVVLSLLCGLVLGHMLRTEALSGVLDRMTPVIAAHGLTVTSPERAPAIPVGDQVLAVGRSLLVGAPAASGQQQARVEESATAPAQPARDRDRPGGKDAKPAGPGTRGNGAGNVAGAPSQATQTADAVTGATVPAAPGDNNGHNNGHSNGHGTSGATLSDATTRGPAHDHDRRSLKDSVARGSHLRSTPPGHARRDEHRPARGNGHGNGKGSRGRSQRR